MPEQNQPIQGPFGNSYSAALPETQQAVQQQAQLQIYQQRQAAQQAAREQSMFDRFEQQETNRALSVDAPDIANAYGQWQDASIAAHSYKGNDPVKINALHNQANQAFAAAMGIANASAARKLQIQQIQTGMQIPNKRPLYADNAADLVDLAANTPTSQAKNAVFKGQPIDLTNSNSYMYQGANTDFGKMGKAAEGMPQNVYTHAEPLDASGVGTKLTPYFAAANPAAYKLSLQGQMQTHNASRDAMVELQKYTPDQIQALETQYKSLPADHWLQTTGSTNVPDVMPRNMNDPTDVYSSILAMQRAINTVPDAREPKIENNAANEKKLASGLSLYNSNFIERVKHGDAQANILLSHRLRQQDAQGQEAYVDHYYDIGFANAQNNPNTAHVGPDGQLEYIDPTGDVNTTKLFTTIGKNPSKPDAIAYSADGSKMRGIFFLRDKNNQMVPDGQGGYKEDSNKGQWVDGNSVRAFLGKELGKTPEARGYVQHSQQPQEKTYNAGGKTYTTSQLLKSGATQEQIDASVKSGILK